MFAVKCRQLVFIPDKILIRNLRNVKKRLDDLRHTTHVNEKIKTCEVNKEIVKSENVLDNVNQYEENFPKIPTIFYECFCDETLIGKYKKTYQIEKQKQYSEHMPNLLTWSEKETIRDLVNKYKWTTERIAENYPVTKHGVEKLIAFHNWKPASKTRIDRHDATAMRNWRELKEGTLNIPENLREHFLKFVDRTVPPLVQSSIKFDKTRELEYIIGKCASQEAGSQYETNDNTFENNKIENVIKVKEETTESPSPYPERIRVPKGTYKKGATYKVNDCFYDDDGRFIYRVINSNQESY